MFGLLNFSFSITTVFAVRNFRARNVPSTSLIYNADVRLFGIRGERRYDNRFKFSTFSGDASLAALSGVSFFLLHRVLSKVDAPTKCAFCDAYCSIRHRHLQSFRFTIPSDVEVSKACSASGDWNGHFSPDVRRKYVAFYLGLEAKSRIAAFVRSISWCFSWYKERFPDNAHDFLPNISNSFQSDGRLTSIAYSCPHMCHCKIWHFSAHAVLQCFFVAMFDLPAIERDISLFMSSFFFLRHWLTCMC